MDKRELLDIGEYRRAEKAFGIRRFIVTGSQNTGNRFRVDEQFRPVVLDPVNMRCRHCNTYFKAADSDHIICPFCHCGDIEAA